VTLNAGRLFEHELRELADHGMMASTTHSAVGASCTPGRCRRHVIVEPGDDRSS